MERTDNHQPFSLEMFLKRSWPLLAVGAVVVLAVAYGLFRFAISIKQTNASTTSVVQQANVATSTEQTASNLVPRVLDGVLAAADQAALQPYAVMVENSPDARPLSGLAEANLVIEAPVEGGITRFMAVFDATTTADQIGPVRSARPYFVEFADALKAVYAHVGGSPEALNNIAILSGFRNFDQFFNGKYFWRSAKRVAPHNAYTRTDMLHQGATDKGWTPGAFTPWKYLPQATSSTDFGTVSSISIPYGGSFNVSWSFDPSTDRYSRSQAGILQRDADGRQIYVTNVLVLSTDGAVVDADGRLHVRTTGSGQAILFRDGQRHDIIWHRKAGDWFSFESVDGSDVLFEPGTTWVSIVTSPSMMPNAVSSSTSSGSASSTVATTTSWNF